MDEKLVPIPAHSDPGSEQLHSISGAQEGLLFSSSPILSGLAPDSTVMLGTEEGSCLCLASLCGSGEWRGEWCPCWGQVTLCTWPLRDPGLVRQACSSPPCLCPGLFLLGHPGLAGTSSTFYLPRRGEYRAASAPQALAQGGQSWTRGRHQKHYHPSCSVCMELCLQFVFIFWGVRRDGLLST